jgi:hypothetical protein
LLHLIRAPNFVRPDSCQLFAALCVLVNRHARELADPRVVDPDTKDCRVLFRPEFTEKGFQQRYESHGIVGRETLDYLEPDDWVEGRVNCGCIHLA